MFFVSYPLCVNLSDFSKKIFQEKISCLAGSGGEDSWRICMQTRLYYGYIDYRFRLRDSARNLWMWYNQFDLFCTGGAKGTIMSRTLVKDRASGQRLVVILKRITGFTLGQNGFNLFRVKTLIYKRLVTKTSRLVTNTSWTVDRSPLLTVSKPKRPVGK